MCYDSDCQGYRELTGLEGNQACDTCCSNGTCKYVLKDWVGAYYCPNKCVGYLTGPQGSCSVGAEGCTAVFNLQMRHLKKLVKIGVLIQSVAETHGNISNWDVMDVTDMKEAFKECQNFNEDISNWDVSDVTTGRYV